MSNCSTKLKVIIDEHYTGFERSIEFHFEGDVIFPDMDNYYNATRLCSDRGIDIIAFSTKFESNV